MSGLINIAFATKESKGINTLGDTGESKLRNNLKYGSLNGEQRATFDSFVELAAGASVLTIKNIPTYKITGKLDITTTPTIPLTLLDYNLLSVDSKQIIINFATLLVNTNGK